jgi:hypothetical protein
MAEGAAPYLATAAEIERWSEDTVVSRTQFPRLIRKAIGQTNDQVTSLQMRADIGAGIEGYDGIVEASRATPFVPEGRSLWELGTSGDPGVKASEDYRKRVKNPLGEDKSKTTFVAVTSRRWDGKEAWARRRKKRGDWLDVRAYDVEDIEQALEEAPAAHFWISELLGKPVAVRTVESWWDRFSSITVPALTPQMVLAGRANEAAALLRALEEDGRITTVASEGTDDVLAFVAAVLRTSPTEHSVDYLGRALIVNDALSLRQLELSTGLLILLPYNDDLRREAQLVANHHVVFLAHADEPADIRLPPIDFEVFLKHLTEQGVRDDQARTYAAAARQSVVRFQRAAGRTLPPVPVWQQQLETRTARRAWLTGKWNERRTGDQDALTAALGVPYVEAREELQKTTEGADPLFIHVAGTWKISSRVESWGFVKRRVSDDDLRATEELVQSVLGSIDPALDLPVEERWAASTHGRARIHSGDLREGLAETLAFLAVHDDGRSARWSEATVARLLGRARDDGSARMWISIADVLPLLAEAAPDTFLEAVEDGLQGHEPLLLGFFLDNQGDAISVNSPHTYMLWALEALAWSPDHASAVIDLLARLAEIDPGGRLSNRPAESLTSILKPWLPRIALTPERRLRVIDNLIDRYELVAWNLMISLLPDFRSLSFSTHEPEFRDWKPTEDEPRQVSPQEYWSFVDSLVNRLLKQAGQQSDRWTKLIQEYSHLSQPEQEAVREHLSDMRERDLISTEMAEAVWLAADDLIRQHRTYADTEWALDEADLVALERTAAPLKPSEPARTWHYLFDEHTPDLGGGSRRADVDNYLQVLQEERTAAVSEILEADSLDGILQLARECELPSTLGYSLADTGRVVDDDRVVALLEDDNRRLIDFAQGFARRRLYRSES